MVYQKAWMNDTCISCNQFIPFEKHIESLQLLHKDQIKSSFILA